MLDEEGNSVVKVKREKLLEEVKKNRDGHRQLFEQAQKGYREAVIKELDVMLAEARANKRIRRMVELPEPIDHTKDYDRIIKMLEMSVDTEIKLTEREFTQYVLDDWGWKEQFIGTASNYTH